MKQEIRKNTNKDLSKTNVEELKDSSLNLGLDADQSSVGDNFLNQLNSDNDRISHNPDGEDDRKDTSELPGNSPLEDK